MFLLGHACWAYLAGSFVSLPRRLTPNFHLLLILGMLPDIDLLLGPLGISHRTVTHSMIFWLLAFAPVFAKYRYSAVPYFAAVSQHILFGDLVVGKTAILWPVLTQRFGLGMSILSPFSLVLEGTGLALAIILFISRKKPATSHVILQLAAILPVAAFAIFASVGQQLAPLLLEGSDAAHLIKSLPSLMENPALLAAVALHAILAGLLLAVFLKSSSRKARLHPSDVRQH